MMEATVFLGSINAAERFMYIDTILSQRSKDNSFDFLVLVFCSDSTVSVDLI